MTLSNMVSGSTSGDDIAYDAVAFVPIAGVYHEDSLEAAALFDENQNIDTSAPGWLAGPLENRKALYDWANKTTSDILNAPNPCTGTQVCLHSATRAAVKAWRDEVLLSGYDPKNHPQGHSIARWINFANSYADRPTTNQRPTSFDDDGRFKIRSKVYVSWVSTTAGAVIPGSVWSDYSHRTGDTHLPTFVRDLFRVLRSEYDIAEPDLSYQMDDANLHDGESTPVNPLADGVLPGRAYAYAGTAPTTSDASGNANASGTCISANYVSGGAIGYRTMLAADGPAQAITNWTLAIRNTIEVPPGVYQLALDIKAIFFREGDIVDAFGSSFNAAPPIWQELAANFCSDGTIRKMKGLPFLRASFMPDQYLYRSGTAMDLDGKTTTSPGPVMTGDFQSFSTASPPSDFPAYNQCTPISERKGNPWSISIGDDAGDNAPHATLCSYEKSSPGYSW